MIASLENIVNEYLGVIAFRLDLKITLKDNIFKDNTCDNE